MPEGLPPHWPLLLGAAGTAAIHALIPDHWVPFVLVGRKQGWSTAKTLAAAALGSVSDALLSAALGVLAILAGEGILQRLAPWSERLEVFGAYLMLGFGILYALWAHARSRGSLPHFHLHFYSHSHDGHSHRHTDSALERASFVALILVAGLSPCFVAVPIFVGTIGMGGAFQALAIGLYFAVTIACTLGVSLAALRIQREFRFPFLERNAETVSGIVLALTGAALLTLGHHHD